MNKETGSPQQTKQTRQLAARIRRLRGKGKTWETVCRELRIFKRDGSPDTGLAYRIALDNYEPKGAEVRERLGLKKICLACMRGIRNISSGSKGSLPPWLIFWRRLPKGEREEWIREYYKKKESK
jgi:hypothetical protein